MTHTFTVAVLGAGTMGRGIAQNAAASGCEVKLFDTTPERANAGRDAIDAALAKLVEKGKLTGHDVDVQLERIEAVSDRAQAVAGADVVVEAAPEDLLLKRTLFAALAREAPAHALLGTNTSSLPVTRIAEGCGAEARVIGLHFFNPVPVMALLEVVRGAQTSDDTLARALDFARRLGKDPIVVKDSPGFATSRLGVLLGLEAMRMLQEGVASAADIDKAMELGYRHPMGPLKLTDLVGLDVRLAIAAHLHRELKSAAFEPPKILREMVAAGKLGRKSGQGFHDYGRP
ncbi:MAG: 3-hydroxyacyl-CoA dehydrogenase family protein [Planctomycetes bacterium]|nr:3-hydroxyacyl-CoA dehydrogenase family protein [Planctomycetota bacterium]